MYRIKIKRKNGTLFTAYPSSDYELKRYIETAKDYGDKVIEVERRNSSGGYSRIVDLAFLGIGVAVGLGALGAITNTLTGGD